MTSHTATEDIAENVPRDESEDRDPNPTSVSSPVAMFSTMTDGTLTFANEAMSDLMGYPNARALMEAGDPFSHELAADLLALVEWADMPDTDWIIDRVNRPLRRRDGRMLRVALYGGFKVGPDKRPIYLQCAILDASEIDPASKGD